jgi:hypothetical protein
MISPPMKNKLSTPLPDALAQRIRDARADIQEQLQGSEKARRKACEEIKTLEAATLEVSGRIPGLKQESLTSDDAAGQLAIAERRALSIELEIAKRKEAANAIPTVDVVPALGVLELILYFYREHVPNEFCKAIAPFDLPNHLANPLLAHANCFQTLNVIRDWIIMTPPANMQTVNRIVAYYDRALRGQICLHRDDIPSEGDPAQSPADCKATA